MVRKIAIGLFVCALLVPFSCAKFQEAYVPAGAALAVEKLAATDAVPLTYGKLVSVTTNPAYPGWFQLWFEDETSTVRMVAYDHKSGKVDANVVVIPRK